MRYTSSFLLQKNSSIEEDVTYRMKRRIGRDAIHIYKKFSYFCTYT